MKTHSLLPYITKPGRYIGNEFNIVKKPWQSAKARFALVFPDLYEIGMSHFGLQILYHLLNREDEVLAERCFTPDLDAEKIMRQKQIPLESLESAQPLNDFDVIGITLPYELCYTNILTILDLANIPKYGRERNASHPIILGGGSCSLNPEPVAPYFDAILLGDGEEAVVEIAGLLKKAKEETWSRAEILHNIEKVSGIYRPDRFQPEYGSNGKLITVSPQTGSPGTVQRRVLADLNATSHLHDPIVPHAKVVHDRLGVEIARGCTRGCRFCQAGMIYRPVRERTTQQILDIADQGIASSGFEELALLSLSTGDHSCINDIIPQLMDRYAKEYVSVSMPSMRVGTLSQPVMDQIKRVRKTGFTIAPEAGSERLRRVINKGITEEDLLSTCNDAFSLGWNTIKLYFMIGLPTETTADIEAIAELARRIKENGSQLGNKRKQITVSVGTFVPKPHTPFQWHAQLSLAESRERLQHLKNILPRKGIKLKWHDPEMSFLEGVFARGDRRLASLIETAWSLGARLDGWSDHFDLGLWQKAAEQCGIDLADYLRSRDLSEVLPWQHLDSGIDHDFLKDEMEKALSGAYTPDCRYHGCQSCGLCDFSTIMPIVHGTESRHNTSDSHVSSPESKHPENDKDDHYKYIVSYSRTGDICFLGHLEILQLIFRTLRRAQIRTNFSQGFNPSPKISFGGALPVGMESDAEFFIMDLPTPLSDLKVTREKLNSNLPEGIRIHEIELHSGKIPQSVCNTYRVTFLETLTAREKEHIQEYLDSGSFLLTRIRKGRKKQIDIRPLVAEINIVDENILELQINAVAGKPGVKVEEALSAICAWEHSEAPPFRIKKTSWKQVNTQ